MAADTFVVNKSLVVRRVVRPSIIGPTLVSSVRFALSVRSRVGPQQTTDTVHTRHITIWASAGSSQCLS